MRLRPFVHETADDLKVAHVLSRRILRSRCRYQPSLAVYNVGHQSAVTDLLQAADQVIHIDNRPDHSQKSAVVHDRQADQHDGARRLSSAYHQGLSAVATPFTRRLVGSLQFSLQKSVGLNASRRNALGVGVQQCGIGDIVRRRNEILQHRAQLWRQKFLSTRVTPGWIRQQHHLNRR